MGQSALIAANGTDRLINIMSLLISFTLRKKHSACICCSGPLTLRWKKGLYLSCSWTWVLSTGPGKETASGNGSIFKPDLSAFVLRQRPAYPSMRSDLRRLHRTTRLQPHPGVPDRVTRLQQYVEGVFVSFLFFFFTFCFVKHLNSLLFCLLLQMTEDTLVYSFSLVYSPTPIGNTVILKTNPAEVLIECHYQRYAQLPPPPKKPPQKNTKEKCQLVSACHPCWCTGEVSHPNPFAELQKSR